MGAKWEWPHPPPPPHPRESGGRATPMGALPQLIGKKGGCAAGLTFASLSDSTGSSPIARKVYRKDAKRSAAHSVRDRLTALLAKRMRSLEGYRELRETHDRTTRCCAPVESALAKLAFSS